MTYEVKRCIVALHHNISMGFHMVGSPEFSIPCKDIIRMIEFLSETAERASAKAAMFDATIERCDQLQKQLEQVTRERDAAIADIKELCMKHSYSMCHYCKYYSDDECEHTDCLTYNSMDAWQWRGCNDEQ